MSGAHMAASVILTETTLTFISDEALYFSSDEKCSTCFPARFIMCRSPPPGVDGVNTPNVKPATQDPEPCQARLFVWLFNIGISTAYGY